MDAFDVISRYFWVICIAFASANYLFADYFNKAIGANVDRELRRRYQRWIAIGSIIPWAVFGYGQLVGGIHSIWEVFRPQDLNPYVWAFYATVLLGYVVGTTWVFFFDGARLMSELQLMRYHVLGRSGAVSPFWIKVMTVASFPFFALWLWMVWHMNVPVQ